MNIFGSQENVFLLGRIVAMAIVLPMFLYAIRHGLRVAHEQFMKLGRFTKCAVICIVFGSTGYAGYKRCCTTNPPPDQTSQTNQTSQTSSPTNDPPPTMMAMLPPQTGNEPPPSTSTSNLNLITNWTARGAWCDWKRIEFGDSSSFPCGTNLLTGVTLMSYGELRESLRGPVVASFNQLPTTSYQLPALSLEPDASSVSYGLTSSNSFVFVWENACVNRDPTNRINAAIELFQSGIIAITTTNYQLPTTDSLPPPTTSYQLPTNPPGFIGVDQDADWAAAAFPNDFAAITNKGYETWLMEDCVGINEPNGRYKVSVTIAALPEHGPCYLVVGPHRMVVTQPGIYSFPLEVFETYKAYTCPTRVPLTFEYDDGYDYGDDPTPPLCMSPVMATAMTPQEELEYELRQIPPLVTRPSRIELSQIGNTPIEILCNMAGAVRNYWVWGWSNVELVFLSQTVAQVVQAGSDCIIEFELRNGKGSSFGYCELYSSNHNPETPSTNDVDVTGTTTNAPPSGTP